MNLSPLRPAVLPLLLVFQTGPLLKEIPVPPAIPSNQSQYQRALTLAADGSSGQVCAVLDADVFAHAAPSLKDLRLNSGQTEIPYAITLSEPLQQEAEDARIINLTVRAGHLTFDLEMPKRPYTALVLDLAARDFIATATVTGLDSPASRKPSALGTHTLFDLTSQHLSRSTSIPLPESVFPYLHIDLTLTASPGASTSAALTLPSLVRGVSVPPSREAQLSYTTVQQQTILPQPGRRSIATFKVPARVPIERIAVALPPGYKGSFSRTLTIEARGNTAKSSGVASGEGASANSPSSFETEKIAGTIFRVHKSEAGHRLDAESLAIPVSIGSNMQQPALIEIKVEDGAGPPVPMTVELQMHQRRICFDSAAARSGLVLTYGDPSLDAPAYGDAKLSQAAPDPRIAELAPERSNSAFRSAPVTPRLERHHPILRWIALLGCVCIFALLVFRRSAKRKPH